MQQKERTSCRICDGELVTVLDIGTIYQSNFLTDDANAVKAPLNLARCTKCNLVQLKHDLDLDTMYRQYWYKSSLNKSMVQALADIVENIGKRIHLEGGDIVVDIGANDGTMLSMFPPNVIKVGFDPALNLAPEAKRKCDVFVNDYFTSQRYPLPSKAKVVTSIAMFYDLADPRTFIEDVKAILQEDGMWVIQFTDLLSMFRINAFDNICHEHVEYYSLRVLSQMLKDHDFEIFDLEYNTVNGGSIRAYVGRTDKFEIRPVVGAMQIVEDAYMDSFDDPFRAFSARVSGIRDTMMIWLTNEVKAGRRTFIAGASTKGNTLLQYFGIDSSMIPYAAEVNSDKFGLKTVGTGIEIISEQKAIKMNPDSFLILPWHFINTFLSTYGTYITKGGKLIVPMPEPLAYKSQSLL